MVDVTGVDRGSGRNGGVRRRGDSPVFVAMAMIAAAAGVGLFMQLGVAGWLSTLGALSLLTAMLALHLLGRRSAEIDELRQELRRLEAEMRRPPQRAAAGQGAANPAAPANSAGPVAGAQTGPAPVAPPPSHTLPATSVTANRQPRNGGSPVRIEQLDEAAIGAAVAQAAQQNGMAPRDPVAGPATPPPVPAQSTSAAQVLRTMHPDAAAPAGEQAVVPRDIPPAVAAQPSASRRPQRLPEAAADPQPAPQQPRAGSVRDTDVEVIQGLIRKLADEVNASEIEAGKAAADAQAAVAAQRRPATQLTDTAIETSLEALRTTADSMREREPRRFEPPAITTTRPATPPQQPPRVPPQSVARMPAPTAAPSLPAHSMPAPPALAQSTPPPVPSARQQPVPQQPVTPQQQTTRHATQRIEPSFDAAGWPEAEPAIGSDDGRAEAMREALEAQRVDVYLEPILTLVDQRPRHYEVQVRPRTADGEVLADDTAVNADLGGSGLLPLLDRIRIARVAVVARRLAERGRDSSIFSGFSGESLVDDEFLNDFANAFHERDSFAGQLVLTFSLADVRAITPRERASLEDMRDLGFRFALDHVTDLDVDFEDLRANGFQFVKLDADVFLEGLPASGGLIPASDICRHLAHLGMTLIVGDIADEAKFARIFGFGVLFGQGQLFGGPRLVKADPAPTRRTAAA